ncbi:CTP:molybdopterin cytidylyltransferase MocA [Paucidesulfovibrio gracilis DSM 16080]|uniref:CTP:molybdopterin cytidylyltransferase MocA n=1 Tax=Paucidesulfovibrio gracilis DSM 16080 TaxID=1121449 RepID=A0A1T4X5I0_9BACT|nr:NTP transferase domain-containing protein [Paucidesulfovibrio gracilis]SKA84796.1 CTP:molybdopterin cytidylyltransferase MocA [Paucidesulfovibrio gracilis DSM 16080]
MLRFSAIILAAGFSSRMGQFKPLLPLGGVPALERLLQSFAQAGIPSPIIVTGHNAEQITPLGLTYDSVMVHNPDHASGMFGSVLTGVSALPNDIDAFFLLPVDIPLIRPQTLQRLSAHFVKHRALITHPVFEETPGHPPLLRQDMIPRILAHDGQGGLRAVLEAHAEEAALVPVADQGILLDMDHPEEYRRLDQRATRDYPLDGECDALLDLAHTPETIRLHCRAVADLAVRMTALLNASLPEEATPLDVTLTRSAALVHDVARAKAKHAQAGANFLLEHGFPAAAPIVRDHVDLNPDDITQITEREIVFLADKFVQGTQRVPLEQRYLAKQKKFQNNPEAVQAVTSRLDRARRVLAIYLEQAGPAARRLLQVG